MKKRSLFLLAGASILALVSCGKTEANAGEDNEILTSERQQQLDFEKDYVTAKYSYAEGGKFAMSMLSNIANICAGVGFDSPTTVVSGVMGLLTSINDTFNGSSGPTIADVMNKLGEMDTKLDAINAKLDENYNQLMSETIRTQAMVDQVLLEEMENAIWGFNANYVDPIEDYTRDFSDYIEQSYKSYVKQDEVADFYVYKTEGNEWALASLLDPTPEGAYEVTIAIDDFTASKTFLEKNYDCVTKGFLDRFNEDLDNAVKKAALPSGLEAKNARDFAAGNLVERMTKEYYVDNHDKALEIRNKAIDYAKQISGRSTKSIVDRYLNRLQYMFNFAGEMKDHVTDACGNLMYRLNTYSAMAAQACAFAGVNQEEIRAEFLNAKDTIQNYYKSFEGVEDNYCFLTHTNVTGGFYRAMYNTYYTNKGNSCSFHANFKFQKVVDSWSNHFIDDDVYAHSYLGQIDHTRIVTRWTLMRELGLDQSENYIKYLVNAKALPKESYDTYDYLLRMKWLSEDALRFFTGISIRDMNDGDRGFTMVCTEAGNPGGDYFNVGWNGTFRGGHDSNKWNGKITETTFIDAVTGQVQTNKRVAAYATYDESHFYWIDDEHWSFVDNPVGNYFFTLENAIA